MFMLHKDFSQIRGAMIVKERASVANSTPGAVPMVQHRSMAAPDTVQSDSFDGVVVCAALGSVALLRPLGLMLRLLSLLLRSLLLLLPLSMQLL